MTHSLTYKGRTVRITLTQEPANLCWTGQWKVVTQGAPETVLHIENIGEAAPLLCDHAMAEAMMSARAWIDGQVDRTVADRRGSHLVVMPSTDPLINPL